MIMLHTLKIVYCKFVLRKSFTSPLFYWDFFKGFCTYLLRVIVCTGFITLLVMLTFFRRQRTWVR